MQAQLGVSRTALLGCYIDKKCRQIVEKHTDKLMKKFKEMNISISRSLLYVSCELFCYFCSIFMSILLKIMLVN